MKIDQGGLTNSMQSSANCNTEVSQVADLIVNYLQQIGWQQTPLTFDSHYSLKT